MSSRHDVAVVGAGPGGAAAAYFLAARGLDVLLLDRASFPRDKTCGDGLTPRALRVLDDMGVLADAAALGRPVGGYEVVAPNGCATRATMPRAPGVPDFALVVRRRRLDALLVERAVAGGATFQPRVAVAGIEREPGGVRLVGDSGGRAAVAHARVAVVATGASAALLTATGLLPRFPRTMLAARAYLEGAPRLVGQLQLRFDAAPLPGYGWVFPVSDTTANVGVGYLPTRRSPPTTRAALERFLQHRPLRTILDGARMAAAPRSYPIRVDFLTAPTVGDGLLLVGEAAGLVNPLTGEGIDYALESGRLAAEHIAAMVVDGDLSAARLAAYDRLLRAHYAPLFRFCAQVSHWCLRAPLLNVLVALANRRADLRLLLANVVLGNRPMAGRGQLGSWLKLASGSLVR